jgi:probable rRNA maturation factor
MADGDHSPRILVDDRQPRPVDIESLVAVARETMIGEGVADAELSLSLVTDEEMAELHERYLGLPGPTDVLSFPLDEDDRDEDGVRLLGDVVVAPSVAARDAPEDPAAELRLLVVHGILHLLGHDHLRDEDRARMWARQQRYTGVRIP